MSITDEHDERLLVIEDLHVTIDDKPILRGVDLVVPRGTVHALMGPNGSGKSTLANVLMGHPAYSVTRGRVLFRGQDVTHLPPDERARMGIFLAFQYPVEVPGVSVLNFLRTALAAREGVGREDPRDARRSSVRKFKQRLDEELRALGMDLSFARRNLNEGFSGGEKKRNEVLQLALLQPALAILDETDSGLDIDAIRIVARAATALRGPERSFLVITHYLRILDALRPDVVHVLVDGRVVRSGGPELAAELERTGYDVLRATHGAPAPLTPPPAAA
jgi:Fe-S cluster assembly ATP-binding protein